ncbi:MAG TPA: LLM class F420-dependent oxidoreductase [Gammaproteobacteria bacterium]|nr:LLM class F420-dependent oxidoreductase [Gammaproteobacteria bacterium]
MKLGVFSFNTEYTMRADELAVAAEERGFESIWFPEHTHIPASRLSPWPGKGPLPKEYIHMSDPFTSAAAAAAVTKTIKLGTGVCLVVEHDPLALAKTVATVDRLSNGRFLFGVGAGWNREEMENHGTPFDRRWKVLEERVKAMKALWTQEEASFHGEYVNFDRVWSYPKPIQQPHPPVILGTFGSIWGRKRVADFGDGWIPIDLFHGDLKADIADLRRRLIDNGRDPDAVTISMFDIFETSEEDLRRFADLGVVTRAIPRCPTEDRDTVLRWLDRYAEIGRRIGAL